MLSNLEASGLSQRSVRGVAPARPVASRPARATALISDVCGTCRCRVCRSRSGFKLLACDAATPHVSGGSLRHICLAWSGRYSGAHARYWNSFICSDTLQAGIPPSASYAVSASRLRDNAIPQHLKRRTRIKPVSSPSRFEKIFVTAVPDVCVARQVTPRLKLSGGISTKLNSSHIIHEQEAPILSCLARGDIDIQASGLQSVTGGTACRWCMLGVASAQLPALISNPKCRSRAAWHA